MSDYISRADAIEVISKHGDLPFAWWKMICRDLQDLPSADAVHGEWVEKEVLNNADDKALFIEEWQSARCSVCGKYHTTPYMYYFDNFNFCPNCGADMRGDGNG